MKIIKKFSLIVLALGITLGCEDTDKLQIDNIIANLGDAGGLRTVNPISLSIDLNNLSESEFAVEVEEWDAEDGNLLDFVEVYVQFQDFTPDNGDSAKPEALVSTVTREQFEIYPDSGLPRSLITVSAQEAISILGLDPSTDIDGGDIFFFRLALHLTDGSIFSSTNLEGNVTGVFFNSPFAYPANVVCDLDASLFAGNYQMEFVSGSGAFGPSFQDESVEITANSGTQRTLNVTWLPAGVTLPLTFDLVCGNINVPNQSTGLACAGGVPAISWQTIETQATFDPANDGVFEVRFNDFVSDGGCGVQTYEVILRFTKM